MAGPFVPWWITNSLSGFDQTDQTKGAIQGFNNKNGLVLSVYAYGTSQADVKFLKCGTYEYRSGSFWPWPWQG